MAHAPSSGDQSTPSAGMLLDAALKYAEYGWSVFPCRVGAHAEDPKDKAPWIAHGFLYAARDEETIRNWWRQFPDASIGIACGASNIVVLDYDPRNDPDKTGYERMCALVGDETTRQALTGSGGAHLYFRSPANEVIRCTANRLASGLDIKGDGGYVIAPPSRNFRGPYRWLNNERLAPLPEAVIAAVRELHRKPQAEAAGADTMIPEGRRHDTLMSMAGTLRRRGLSPITIEKALLSENEEHCASPLPEEEVLRMARDAGKYPGGDPVFPPTPHESEPQATVMDFESVSVAITLGDTTRATFTFTDMRKTSKGLACHMSLSFFGIGQPYQQRLDLDSSSARTELRRELDNNYGKEKSWGLALNTVWSMARDTFLTIDRSTPVDEIPLLLDSQFLIDPLVVADGSTVLFGDGSSSKSYLAQAMALASATGIPMAGVYQAPHTNVMYVDYETGDTNFRRRTDRICQGLGINSSAAHGLRYWRARGEPLIDIAGGIRRSCEQNGVGWIIVDSAAPATGDAPESAEAAVAFFRAIEMIGLPCLVIAHIVKSANPESTKKPFGSAFYSNLARRTWFVARSQDEESDRITTALYCRKVNDGPLPRPLGFTTTFDGKSGPVRFTVTDPGQSVELSQHGSVSSRLWSVLDHPLTLKEVCELTGINQDTARITMKRQSERFLEVQQLGSGPKGGRPATVWSRVRTSDSDIEERPF